MCAVVRLVKGIVAWQNFSFDILYQFCREVESACHFSVK